MNCVFKFCIPLVFVGAFSSLKGEQVVIREVMYHPPAGLHEFIEVENLTATIYDIAQWKVRGAVDFDFPVFTPDDLILV